MTIDGLKLWRLRQIFDAYFADTIGFYAAADAIFHDNDLCERAYQAAFARE